MTASGTVCLKGRLHDFGPALELAPHVVYVGRAMYQGGWRLPASQFANPYRTQEVGGAARAVELYREMLRTRPGLVALARERLRGKQLGCWCMTGPCHASLLALIADGGAP